MSTDICIWFNSWKFFKNPSVSKFSSACSRLNAVENTVPGTVMISPPFNAYCGEQMRYNTRHLSEYKAHNNSECRTGKFSTIDTGTVYLVAFLANYDRIPTCIVKY